MNYINYWRNKNTCFLEVKKEKGEKISPTEGVDNTTILRKIETSQA